MIKFHNGSKLKSDFLKEAARYQYYYSIVGLISGTLCFIGGIILFLSGITGSANWTAKILVAESTIHDAAPGALLFISGLFIIFITRYQVESKGSSQRNRKRKRQK